MTKEKQTKGFIIGAVVGGVIGSLSALLFAPKAGKELRQDISSGAHKVGDATGRIAKQIGGGASQLADRTKLAAEALVSNVKGWGKGSDSTAIAAQEVEEDCAEAEEQAASTIESVESGEVEAATAKEQ